MKRAVLGALWITLVSASAYGQTAPVSSDVALASAHYQTGTAEYRAGHFAQAAVEFREAYRLSRDPALLFNVGSALYDANDPQGALDAFVAYLEAMPTAANRPVVEGRIASLRARVATSAAPSAAPMRVEPVTVASSSPPPRVPVEPTRAASVPVGAIVLGGAGVLVAASSVLFYALRASALAPCTDESDAIVCPDAASANAGITYSALTNWSLGIGAAMIAGGAVWLIVARTTDRAPRTTASIVPLPEGGALLGVGGRF